MPNGYIYGLYDSKNYRIFYIGSTTKELKRRLQLHLAASKIYKTPVAVYIRQKIIDGFAIGFFKLKTIEITEENTHSLYEEEKMFVRKYINDGYSLVNVLYTDNIIRPAKRGKYKIKKPLKTAA